VTEQHYHDPADKKYGSHLRSGAGPEFDAYLALAQTVGRTDGAVPVKYRELIAIAVALTTQCVYCIETHVDAAKAAGVTSDEISETVFVAAALRAGGAVAHGRLALKLFERSDVGDTGATG
jgi:AhpD family alkylhydroperoxidase